METEQLPVSRPDIVTLRIPNSEETHRFATQAVHTVSDLMFRIQDAGVCSVTHQRLVHQGRILSPEEPINVLASLPCVVLARKAAGHPAEPPVARPPRYGDDPCWESAPTRAEAVGEAADVPMPGLGRERAGSVDSLTDPGERTCRICLDTGEGGRMISPCLCRGSSKFVHVECLNRWRASSTSRVSFFQCDVCGYRYNLRRTEWASRLQSDGLPAAATVLLIALGCCFSGSVLHCLSVFLQWQTACDPFFEVIEFWPYQHMSFWNPVLDAGLGGLLLLGFGGLVLDAYERYLNDTLDYRGLVFTIFANNNRILRVFVILGFTYAFSVIHSRVSAEMKAYMARWGEEILEPSALAAPPPQPPARAS
eukprot:TRINITY_DN26377_c0_g1_i1.p1 TRINITY_DN26377_c0_g1~~TRINITY_DN26377_c0_g1_i1.p1  ORF type:complete len:366 (+),score=59.48 TRINITY_DN26377_c0_g1_i1:212-1309(+)